MDLDGQTAEGFYDPQTTSNKRTHTSTANTHRPIQPRSQRIRICCRGSPTTNKRGQEATPSQLLFGNAQ
jgi:hypothetical protein